MGEVPRSRLLGSESFMGGGMPEIIDDGEKALAMHGI